MASYSFPNDPSYPTLSSTLSVDFTTYTTPNAYIVLTDGNGWTYRELATITDAAGGVVEFDFNKAPRLRTTQYTFQYELYDGDTLQNTLPASPNTLDVTEGSGSGAAFTRKIDFAEIQAKYNSTTGVHDLRSYGADPSGSTSSDSALDDAIAAANPNDTILLKDGTYQLTGGRIITKPITIRGDGAEITRPTNNSVPAIRFSGGGPTGTSSGISSAISKGKSVIPVADASLFSQGDDVMITSGAATRDDESPFDFASVMSTDTTNNTLTIDNPTAYDYPASASGGKVAIVDFMDGPELINLECNGDSSTLSWFLMEWTKNGLYQNVDITHHQEEGMFAFACWKTTWRNCSARWANGRTSGDGEPFKASKCQASRFLNPYVSECRRGVDLPRYSHNNYIENPTIKKFSIGGVSSHGTRAENTTITGGTLTGDETVTGGTAIYNQEGHWTVNGTKILASGEGIAANGNFNASGVEIKPIDADAQYALSMVDRDNVDINATIKDPNGWFGGTNNTVVHINALNEDVRNVKLDLNVEVASVNAVRVISSTGNVVENLTLEGKVDHLGADGYGVRVDGSLRNFKSSMDSINGTSDGYLFQDGEYIEGLTLEGARVECGTASAVLVNSTYTSTNRIWVRGCDLNGGDALRVLRTDAADVHVWNNRMNGTVDVASTQSSVTVEQGDGSGLDSDTIDGREIYVSSTEPANWSDGDIWLQSQ